MTAPPKNAPYPSGPADLGNRDALRHRVADGEAGERLDRCLAAAHPSLSRSRIKVLIEQGNLRITEAGGGADETLDDASYRVKPGQLLALTVPPPEEAVPRAQAIALRVIYEDRDLIVIDKPAGMVVHPAPGNPDGTLVNALIAHCGDSLSGIGGVRRPGIVHRIDKNTSGLIVAAKNDDAHKGLSEAFAAHAVEREYRCFVWGLPSPKSGTIEGNIGRHGIDRKRMAIVKSGGKHAVTHYQATKVFGLGAAELACQLETGRTHQIRVHLAAIGHPLIGDPVYGRVTPARRKALPPAAGAAAAAFPRQALHAAILGFAHPRTGKRLHWNSPLPSDLAELAVALSGR
ncbi:MAG TPA: RluA family pseudouridine synthase [Dongiaceae bacterium]|nr:RluA family pseudouridine synthase [Dongiaceae bacterium]